MVVHQRTWKIITKNYRQLAMAIRKTAYGWLLSCCRVIKDKERVIDTNSKKGDRTNPSQVNAINTILSPHLGKAGNMVKNKGPIYGGRIN